MPEVRPPGRVRRERDSEIVVDCRNLESGPNAAFACASRVARRFRRARRGRRGLRIMSYELQVHALSPARPSAAEVVAQAGESGVEVEIVSVDGAGAAPGVPGSSGFSRDWTEIVVRAPDSALSVVVRVAADRAERLAELRSAREAGETVPEEVFDAPALYVVEIDASAGEAGGEDAGEEREIDGAPAEAAAAFVVTAWALATLTEAIVFDPQEEFFADAESFWALVMDEDAMAAPEPWT